MEMSMTDRLLRTEELYLKILHMAKDPEVSETRKRGVLDAIFHMGQIEARLTALKEIPPTPRKGEIWHRRGNQDNKVEVMLVSAGIVTMKKLGCGCGVYWHEATDHVTQVSVNQFREQYVNVEPGDRLVEDWWRIVESAL